MLLFLDTEYTGLGQSQPKLISLALVAEDGSREFYVELDDTWTVDDCTGFVQLEVLPLLTGPRAPRAEACTELREWLTSAPRAVTIACDSETDWRFLLGLLGLDRPRNLSDHYYDLRPLIDTPVYDRAVQAYYRGDDRMHHALADARAYRCGWLAWMDAKKTALPPDLAAWESAEPVGREFGAITTPPTTTLVVDLEATCDEDTSSFDMETIEIGAVWIAADGVVLDRFQSFVRPIVNPTLTLFCSKLTGITQADVDAAPLFPVAADELRAFVAKHQQASSVWMSYGAYDRKQLERDSARHGIAAPIALPHQNAKRLFAKNRRIKEVGMVKACELVGLVLAGTHHRALDDALNVARLLPWVWRSPPPAAGLAALKGAIPTPARPVTTDAMHEAIGNHIKGEWMGSSPGFLDEGRSDQQQAERTSLFGALVGRVASAPEFDAPLGLSVEVVAQLRAVPVQLRADGRPYYVRLADIPQPWRDEFRAALHGSGCPAIVGEGECAYVLDWADWLQGRFPRL